MTAGISSFALSRLVSCTRLMQSSGSPTDSSAPRISAGSSPLLSATATPSMTTTISPSGGKFTKLSMRSPSIIRTPSPETRLRTAIRFPSAGETTAVPSAASSQLASTTTAASTTNSQNGWGSLLPARSTTSNTRSTGEVPDRFRTAERTPPTTSPRRFDPESNVPTRGCVNRQRRDGRIVRNRIPPWTYSTTPT